MVTPVSGANFWLTLNSTYLSFDTATDNSAAEAKEGEWNSIRLTEMGPDSPRIFIDDEEIEPFGYGKWMWKPKGFAGNYSLSIRWGKGNVATTNILVVPSAISQSRYNAMLDEIQIISEDLLYQTRSPAAIDMQERSISPDHSPALREFEWIREIFPELADVMSRIKRAPHRKLLVRQQTSLLHQVTRFSAEVQAVPGAWVALPATGAENIARLGWLPQNWLVEENDPSFDTNENRMIKRFLWNQLMPRVLRIRERALTEIKLRKERLAVHLQKGWPDTDSEMIHELEKIRDECAGFARECVTWGSEPFLKETQTLFGRMRPSQVLQKNPQYQRFYKVYLKFQSELGYGIDHAKNRTKIGSRRLSEIYEMWAMFKIATATISLLRGKGYKVLGQTFFVLRDDLFQVEVDRSVAVELVRGEDRILIRYEPTYPARANLSLPAGIVSNANEQRTPDLAVELWREGSLKRVIIFDAKYRYDNERDDHKYLQDDISKMWDYYNVLKLKRANSAQLRDVVEAAYMVYPGGVIEHDREQIAVGALPLLPEMDEEQMAMVARSFREIIGCIAP